MAILSMCRQAVITAAVMMLPSCASFHYMPGVKPQTFEPNAEVVMKVNAMTSIHTQIPRNYYALPFCQPNDGPEMASENLGEFLTGNKIMSSAYTFNMLREVYCSVLCQSILEEKSAKLMKLHIKHGYHNNWIIDNLPSASLGLTEAGLKQRHYAGGFPIGFVDNESGEAFVYNHVNIILEYHRPDPNAESYRVVGFAVEPISVAHKYENSFEWDGKSKDGFSKPLVTCPEMGMHTSRAVPHPPQPVETGAKVLFTYDVLWNPSEVQWASRWDVYLTEDDMVPAQVHWYSITNSILVVLFLSLMVVNVLIRNLRRDIAGYNAVPLTDEEKADEVDESGWKLVHGDVFRPPTSMPMLFCVFVGSGLQICAATLACIVFSAVGFLSPARRGSLMTMSLVFYVCCGSFAGYASSRLYKTFRGRNWQMCTLLTACFFPGCTFALFIFFNIILAFQRSSASVPFLDVLIVVCMWCCISIPMVFAGAYFGYKKDPIQYPTKINQVSRSIPEPSVPWHNPKLAVILTGMIPFAATYVELFFIMTSLWMDQYYYVFGFTLIVYILLLITCAEGSILACYYLLCAENHRWWWYSFFTSGSTAFYMMAYSVVWFKQLEASKMVLTYMLYFGYMFIISLGVFLSTGMVGFFSCFIFTRKIYASIKVD